VYDPAIPVLGIHLEKKKKTNNLKSLIQKDICTPMFNAALFATPKLWKQSKCSSMDEWIKM